MWFKSYFLSKLWFLCFFFVFVQQKTFSFPRLNLRVGRAKVTNISAHETLPVKVPVSFNTNKSSSVAPATCVFSRDRSLFGAYLVKIVRSC